VRELKRENGSKRQREGRGKAEKHVCVGVYLSKDSRYKRGRKSERQKERKKVRGSVVVRAFERERVEGAESAGGRECIV